MNACHILRRLVIGVVFWCVWYSVVGSGNVVADIPRNEVNIHAYRYFYKHWPSVVGEQWNKTEEGYEASFVERSSCNRVYFNSRGRFLYAYKYYRGEESSPELINQVRMKYPDHSIKLVTEVTDGNKTFYIVNIMNGSSIKNLSIVEGKMELREELINGSPTRN